MKTLTLTGAGNFSTEILRMNHQSCTPSREVVEYEVELYYQSKGSVTINGEKYPFEDGTLLIFRPGDVRSSTLPFQCRYLHFILNDEDTRQLIDELPHLFRPADSTRLASILDAIAAQYPASSRAAGLRVTGHLFSLLAELTEQTTTIAKRSSGDEAIDTAKAYMDKYYASNLTLSEIAEAVHLTPNHFCAKFTKVCGITAREYLIAVRLSRARQLLATTENSITEIAESCGINSYNYFSALFRKTFGISPSKYRRQCREQNRYLL